MDIGTVVGWVQLALWIVIGVPTFFARLVSKRQKGEEIMNPRARRFLSSDLTIGAVLAIGVLISTLNMFYILKGGGEAKYEKLPEDKVTLVEGQAFANETVETDGKRFDHCSFTNARFDIGGRHQAVFMDNDFYGTLVLHTDSSTTAAYLELVAIFGGLKDPDQGVTWRSEKENRGFTVMLVFPSGNHSLPNTQPSLP